MPKRQTAKRRSTKKTKRRFTLPFPLIIFLLLCAGVYLTLASFKALADGDVQVTARIDAVPVTSPATITSPADGTHFTAVPITITGTCPANAAYVKIYRNNVMSGSAICQTDNSFSLQIDLFAGENDLVAHVFNVTDAEGPVSTIVKVFYDVPTPPPSSGGTGSSSNSSSGSSSGKSGSSASSTPGFVLTTPFVYKGYFVNDTVSWPVDISGGSAPYAFNIDWGDGSNSVISRKNADAFDITHVYTKAGGVKGSYPIKIQGSDGDSHYAYLQFFVIVSDKTRKSVSGVGSIYSKPPPKLNNLTTWLEDAWPIYGSLIIMASCYKLGEWEEVRILNKHNLKQRHA